MKLLSIDCAGKTAAAAVSEGDHILAEGFADAGLTHSQALLPLIDRTLKQAGVAIGAIEAFAVTSGPGSFTGLRIGCSLVKGMALGRPCIPIPTLMALACNERESGRVAVALLDARCKQVYLGGYSFEKGRPEVAIADRACSLEEAEALIAALDRPAVLLGDGAGLLEHCCRGDRILRGAEDCVKGAGIAYAASFLEPVPPERLVPSYFRLSQAEREYQMKKEQKNGSNGLR